MTAAVDDAAWLAAVLPMDHPIAQVARLQLDAHVRAERRDRMAKIEAPNAGFNGESCGVAFTDGIAHTDDAVAINYFEGAGYTVDGERFLAPPVVEDLDVRDLETVRINPYSDRA